MHMQAPPRTPLGSLTPVQEPPSFSAFGLEFRPFRL